MGLITHRFEDNFITTKLDLGKGLGLTLRYTPQPAFTFQYPAERRPVAPRFRGILRLQVAPAACARKSVPPAQSRRSS
jgi:formate hydrogenlyase subunit 6/NADH:ubiquinone oxidoreductase subunit I